MTSQRRSLELLQEALVECRRCDRLVAWREEVARVKRRAYRDETYWGRPIPGFGDPDATLILMGLAPAAHGGNRTGRMFTGDRSGDFLYAALHRAGVASQPTSVRRGDGLTLTGAFIVAPCRCAPPENKPTPAELAACRPWLEAELALLDRAHTYLALGKTGYDAVLTLAKKHGDVSGAPAFAHGARGEIPDPRGGGGRAWLFGSYHVSQQNTQTGRLTAAMFDEVLGAALERARR
ncbi:uracil-DNA glycosylase [Polyangium fumosum]|uniref:Type-5 uracil-DNA glycosylase n=1 Tax=Polyangium fumosum TaxID=889272 RepID=A0A4U1J3P0_9BACT|nr:uracil-DNA glycosylase [Polyangium fumosum]TKD01803.1 uracil-DNA glycosylase [Polyangium fumosum]